MSTPVKLPGSLDANRRLDQWLRFNNLERTVTVCTGKVDGINVRPSHPVAEEACHGIPQKEGLR